MTPLLKKLLVVLFTLIAFITFLCFMFPKTPPNSISTVPTKTEEYLFPGDIAILYHEGHQLSDTNYSIVAAPSIDQWKDFSFLGQANDMTGIEEKFNSKELVYLKGGTKVLILKYNAWHNIYNVRVLTESSIWLDYYKNNVFVSKSVTHKL
jgi:hypothetical protein